MKKLWIMLALSTLMLIPAFAAEKTVYVSDGGTGDGSSASSPVGTLAKAYAALGDAGGTIVIRDKLTVSSTFVEPAHSGEVILTGGTLAVKDIRYVLNGPTTFEHITLQGISKYLLIVAQFNPIVFGEGITVKGFGDFSLVARSICIVGGVQAGADKYNDSSLLDKDTYITVKSGKALIIGMCRGVKKDFTGTSHINIEGGTLYNIYYGSSGGSGGSSELNISGGTFIYNIYSNAKIGKLTGDITVRITGGNFSASTLERFDGSVIGANATSVVDLRGYANYSTVVKKMENFTKIITDDGEVTPKKFTEPNSEFAYGSFTASDGTVIPYRYYLPADYATSGKKYPVFLYMHGNGSRGTDNKAHLSAYSINTAVFNSDYECIMIAPQCPPSPKEWTMYSSIGVNTYPGSEAYAEFLESGEPYGSEYFCAAAELLDMFLSDYRVDTSRIYLGGGSNGAGAVWNLMALYPEVFAAAVPVAGSRATEDFVHSVAHRYKDIAIWAFHGDKDNEAGVPPEGTRIMYAAVKEIGGNMQYTEVAGGNHSNIWRIAADTEGLIDWMFAQKNDAFENTILKEKGEALPAPANLALDGETIKWDAVEHAGAYKVTVCLNDIAIKTYCTYENSYTPGITFRDSMSYTVSVRAYPQTNRYSISAESVMHIGKSDNRIILTIGKKEATVFGKTVTNDVAPIIRNDRTMLPARFVAENLGATVLWKAEEPKKITIVKEDTELILYIGSDKAYVNGKEIIIDSPAFIEKDRTYCPTRFICETLGATVEWNAQTAQAIITK